MSEDAVCCPKFNPDLWDNQTFQWTNKPFIQAKVFTLFYIPVNYGSVMTRSVRLIETSGAKFLDGLCLSECTSAWNMNLYLAVDKKVDGAENVSFTGKFTSKVYEGDFKDTGKWLKDFENYLQTQNTPSQKIYQWYTTCPQCAQKYGKNYVVLIGKIN